MSTWELLDQKKGEVGPWLRRSFWLPLRTMLRMFHILPVSAALIVFVLLATDGQLREIYVSYMEDLGSDNDLMAILHFVTAALGFALISAVLYEAHYLLSAERVMVIYSSNADIGRGSRLRAVRDAAAIVLAMAPWLGLVAGLLHAKIYLADLFHRLQQAGVPNLNVMQHVPMPGISTIIVSVLALGFVMSFFVSAYPRSRVLQRPIILATPPGAALLFLLLTDPPQLNPSPWQIAVICLAVVGFMAVYYFMYTALYAMRPHVFSRHLQERTGINLRRYQGLLLFLLALFPWAATVVLYLLLAPPSAKPGQLHGWAMIPATMSWVISVGTLVVFLLYQSHRRSPIRLKWTIYGTILTLAIVGLFISWFSADKIVAVYRLLGPLGSLTLAFLFLTSIFALVAALSQQSGFPALTLVIVVLVGSVALPISIGWTAVTIAIVCLAAFILAMTSGLWAIAAVAIILAITGAINFAKMHRVESVELRSAPNGEEVAQQFASWLDKQITAKSNAGSAAQSTCSGSFKQHPVVYIVAAAGGGIYAASAASVLLARLQDRAPCFTRHVFAISAVSGGAIGSTIFQSLVESRLEDATAAYASGIRNAPAADEAPNGDCLPPLDGNRSDAGLSLEEEVSEIIQGDHFSPLVASIFPELLGFTRSGRAQELAASFEHSVNKVDRKAAETLCEPFVNDWSVKSDAPALILNATWVENGYRAAFAPFPLHKIDESLYSFADKNMPADPPNNPVTKIEAALVSARFPVILPPYSLLIKRPNLETSKKGIAETVAAEHSTGNMRWNFVDGGYSDTTGATTALVLYQALQATATKNDIRLRLVLITSSDPQLQPGEINGTLFADTLGPIDAMMSVRDGLGNEAVARTCNAVSNDGISGHHSCGNLSDNPDSSLQIIGIEDQTYGLSLGWKISQTTFGVISWMLGQPEFVDEAVCNQARAKDSNSDSQANGQFTFNENVVCQNSHVVAGILQSLGYKQQSTN